MSVPQQDGSYRSELNHGESPTALPSPPSVPRDQTNLPLFAPPQRQFHLLVISCPACISVTHKTNPAVMSQWTPQLRALWVTTTTVQWLSHLGASIQNKWGFKFSRRYQDYGHLECDAVWLGRWHNSKGSTCCFHCQDIAHWRQRKKIAPTADKFVPE